MKTKNTGTAEYAILPSKGLLYEGVNPEIKVSSMLTRHEIQRLAPSELPYKNLCDVMDECIVDEMPISVYDMCLGDFQYLTYKLRIATYGSKMQYTVTCPGCFSSNSLEIDLNDFKTIEIDENKLNDRTIKLSNGDEVTVSIQTPRSLDQATLKTKEFKRKRKGASEDPTFIHSVESCIEKINGLAPNGLTIDEYIRNLPMRDTTAILNKSAEINSLIGVDTTLTLKCPDCGKENVLQFKVTSEFFRPTNVN